MKTVFYFQELQKTVSLIQVILLNLYDFSHHIPCDIIFVYKFGKLGDRDQFFSRKPQREHTVDDGTADAAQANVVSGHAYNGEYITLASPAGTAIVNAEVDELPEGAPTDYEFPYGLISFAINNDTADGVITDPGAPGNSTQVTPEEDDDSGSGGGCFVTVGNSHGMNPLCTLLVLLIPAVVLVSLRSTRIR